VTPMPPAPVLPPQPRDDRQAVWRSVGWFAGLAALGQLEAGAKRLELADEVVGAARRLPFTAPWPHPSRHWFRAPPGARYKLPVGESPSVDEVMDDLEVADVLGKEGHSFHVGGSRDGEVDLAASRIATTTGHRGGELTPHTGNLDAHGQGVEPRPFHSRRPRAVTCGFGC